MPDVYSNEPEAKSRPWWRYIHQVPTILAEHARTPTLSRMPESHCSFLFPTYNRASERETIGYPPKTKVFSRD